MVCLFSFNIRWKKVRLEASNILLYKCVTSWGNKNKTENSSSMSRHYKKQLPAWFIFNGPCNIITRFLSFLL